MALEPKDLKDSTPATANEPPTPATPATPVDPATPHDSALDPRASCDSNQPLRDHAFPIVGIGASAGGLEAFRNLLAHLPEQTGMAFVLIQHLDPAHESELADLLSRATRMPVTEVIDGMVVAPDHVYIIPPGFGMALKGDTLKLTPRGEGAQSHLPFDFFLRSLARERQGQAIGVVLSGTGSDGTLGLAEIKVVGGITFAQDEESAEYAAMPLSAIGNGCVDFVLSPGQIAVELARIGQHPYLRPAASGDAELDTERDYGKILGRLRSSSGVDFSDYRDTTIKRRIARRMALQQMESTTDYLSFLRSNPAEVEALYRDVLINVTSFFRDPEVFEAIKKTVFPRIMEGNRSPQTPIRIWVPGCSTGQEAYSLAMALVEFLDPQATRPTIQIFGTDISDEAAVEKARPGVYPPSIEAEVSPERLQRFFIKAEGGYRISKAIRDMCVFARHDLAADPPFSRLDLISCRNLLIYLSHSLQQRIIPIFHYALNPGGMLVLGPSETVGKFSDLFGQVDRTSNIYCKLSTLTPPYPSVPPGSAPPPRRIATSAPIERVPALVDMRREADRVIMGRFAPAAVLIDDNMEILQFRGRTAPYLEPPTGQPTHNLLKMARDKLFLDLRGVVAEARQTDGIARREKVRVQDEHGVRLVDLEVSPIRLPGLAQRCFLVLFLESGDTSTSAAAEAGAAAVPQTQVATRDDQENADLRRELASVKEYLQAIIEQQSAANEELQSANEEVRSSNEELQSTNEEMQTAKEELQSSNEELRTVNDELQARSHEMSQLGDDLTNTLTSIKLAVVMLGADLCIRRFTPAAATLLNLSPPDLGRPFADIRPNFEIPDMQAAILDVVTTLRVGEREAQDRNGRWYRLAMHPYRASDSRIDGVVLVWHDIHESKRFQEQLQQAKSVTEAAGKAKDQFLAVLSHELRTPLAPVIAAVSMLKEHNLDADTGEVLDIIHRNVELQARLIDDLLDVTRIERGKIELIKETVQLRKVIERAIEVCRPDLSAREMEFGVDWGPGSQGGKKGDEGCWVEADVARLQQVFWNLIRNSIKFTPHGGCIGVKCRKEKGNAIVEVTDSGIGIDREALPRLFNSFEQAERSITRRFGGLGLGLAICRALVQMHGGTIEAHSEGKDKGATFRVSLPLAAGPSRSNDKGPTTAKEPSTPLRILLVEDHGDSARIMGRVLTNGGHEVHAAGDVATALQLLAHGEFDLLMSDLGLPDGSGVDLMKELRRRGHTLPGIALSGYGQEEDLHQSREAGFAQHLIKPATAQQLLAAVAEIGAKAQKA